MEESTFKKILASLASVIILVALALMLLFFGTLFQVPIMIYLGGGTLFIMFISLLVLFAIVDLYY